MLKPITYCFIDASNLFYGGVKKMGWKVDYQKLILHLKSKYNASEIYYYGGIEMYDYTYNYTSTQNFPIDNYLQSLRRQSKQLLGSSNSVESARIESNIKKAKFYNKLESFGYKLKLKPIKHIIEADGRTIMKANCDVDLTFDAMRLANVYDRFVLLSGDGDFEILLKYFLEMGKEVIILSNPSNTAKRLKQNFNKQFKNFEEIREAIEFKE